MNSTTADECINVNDSYQAHIFRNLHEAIVVLDRAYAIAYWNGMAEEILGWSSGEAAGKNVRELLKPAFFRSSWDTEIARMLREKSYEGMVELQKKDGGKIYTIVHANVLRDSEGRVCEIIVSIWDSTRRKQAHFELMDIFEAMKTSDDKFQVLVDSMFQNSEQVAFQANLLSVVNEAIVAIDSRHVVTYWNHAAQVLYGWTVQETVGRKLMELYRGGGSQGALRYDVIRTMLTKDCWHGEAVHRRKDGTEMAVEAYTRILRGADGTFRGVISAVRDITDRKRVMEEMRCNQEAKEFLLKLSDTLKKLEDPVQIQETAARALGGHLCADRVLYCEVVQMDGNAYYDIRHIYHGPDCGLPSGFYPICNYGRKSSADRPELTKVVRDIETEPLIDELDHPLHDTLKLRAWIRVPLIKNGKHVACLAVYQKTPRDWTSQEIALAEETAERTRAALERARVKKDLLDSQARLRAINEVYQKYVECETLEQWGNACLALVEGITGSRSSFVGIIGEDGRFSDFAISTGSLEQCRMQSSAGADLHSPEFPVKRLCGSVLRSGKTLLTNAPSEHPDNMEVPEEHVRIESFLGVPYIRDGRVFGMIALANRPGGYTAHERELIEALAPTVIEMLLRKRAEEELEISRKQTLSLIKELRRADAGKNEFLSTLSHELRNPLAVLTAGLQLLDMTDEPERARKFKDMMYHQILQLCGLVDDLLDLTRIAHNKIALNREDVDLGRLALLAAEDIRPLFDDKGVGLRTRVAADALYVNADPVRMRQITGNLLNNALKFTDPGGQVVLSVQRDHGSAVICVEDTGIGIAPEELQDLFKPFMQTGSSLTKHKSGLGLGLAITKGIAELHGGTAHAKSDGPGKGSSFFITLPAGDGIPRAVPVKEADIKPARSLNILIVDDNRDFVHLICSMLELFGHTATAAYSAIDGLEKARVLRPDVVFCDIGMPEMNGYEFARAIRREEGVSGIYLIALTGYARNEDSDKAMQAGFNRHMAKPVCAAGLKEALQGAERNAADE